MKGKYYPEEFYANLVVTSRNFKNDPSIESMVQGVLITLDPESLARILSMQYQGNFLRMGKTEVHSDESIAIADVARAVGVELKPTRDGASWAYLANFRSEIVCWLT